MQHVVIGIVFIVVGLVVIALQPAVSRGLKRRGDGRTAIRTYGNVAIGVVIAAFGVAIAAGGFR